MKRIITAVLTVLFTLPILCSCHGAVDIQNLEITDIYGAGTRTVCVYSWVGNGDYISLGEKQVEFLNQYLKTALGDDALAYTLKYEGIKENTNNGVPTDTQVNELFELTDEEKSMGYNCISMTYSFENIDDYNIKTERIYALSESLAVTGEDENYGRAELEDYSPATIAVKATKEDKYYKVSFNEKGQTSVGLTAWALIALWQERNNTELWKTSEIAYEPLTDDETKSIYSALKTTVNVTVGDSSKRIRTVSQTPVLGQGTVEGVDYTVSGIIYSNVVPAQLKNEVSTWDAGAVTVIAVIVISVIIAAAIGINKFLKRKKQSS